MKTSLRGLLVASALAAVIAAMIFGAARRPAPAPLPPLRVSASPGPLAERIPPSHPDRAFRALTGETRPAPELLPEAVSKALHVHEPEALKERDGIFGFNGERYAATFERGWVEVAAPFRGADGVRPVLSFSLESVKAGDVLLARGEAISPSARGDERVVAYDRGAVEERYDLLAEAVEQTFVIHELPEARGAITVTGVVESNLTPPKEGARAKSLAFTHEGHALMEIREAVAIDAAGRRLALDLAYAGGRMSMTVPAAWVKDAALPIRVDPLVGGWFDLRSNIQMIYQPAGAVRYHPNVDVAWSAAANLWLVVWCEGFGATTTDILSRVVYANGTMDPTTRVVGNSANEDFGVSLAYSTSGNNFVVAFSQWVGTTTRRLAGNVVSGTGIPGTQFTILDVTGTVEARPSVATDGSGYYVVCEAYNGNAFGQRTLHGRFLSSSGGLGSQVDPLAGVSPNYAYGQPSVAFSGSCYTVAFRSWFNGLVVRRLSTGGAWLDTPYIASGGDSSMAEIKVSAGPPGKFLLAWCNWGSSGVLGRIFNDGGGFETGIFTIASYGIDQLTADWSDANEKWMVAWPDGAGQNFIYTASVTPTGAVAAGDTFSTGAFPRWPRLAYNAATNDFLCAWIGGAVAGQFRVSAQRLNLGAPPPPDTPGYFWGTAMSTSTILWQWWASDKAASYRVEESGSTLANVPHPTTSWTQSGLGRNQPVNAYVVAVGPGGDSGPSNSSWVFTLLDKPTDEHFRLLRGPSGDSVRVQVVPPPNATLGGTGVRLEWAPDGANFTSWVSYAGVYDFVLSGLPYGAQLPFRIRYLNGNAVATEPCDQVKYWITAPTAPAGFTLTPLSHDSLRAAWTGDIPFDLGVEIHSNPHVVEGATAPNANQFIEGGLTENTAYTRHGAGFNDAGRGLESASATATTPIRTPTLADITATALGPTSIRVDVYVPANPTSPNTACKIEWSTAATGPWTILKDWSAAWTATHGGLTGGSVRYYRVIYRNTANATTPYSTPARQGMTSTAAPAGFASTSTSPTTLVHSWAAASGATGYQVDTETHAEVGKTAAGVLTLTESGLLPNHAYARHVHGLNAGGKSPDSNIVTRFTRVADILPGELKAQAVSSSSVLITLNRPPNYNVGQTACQFEWKLASEASWRVPVLKDYNAAWEFTQTGLTAGVAVNYRARVRNGDGLYVTPWVTVAVTPAAPAAPTGLAGVGQSTTSISWSWANSGTFTHNEVHRSGELLVASPPASPWVQTGLKENSPETLHVHAMNGQLRSAASATVTAYTRVHDPTLADFAAKVTSATLLDVTVVPPPNPTTAAVKIEWKLTSGTTWNVAQNYVNNDFAGSFATTANTSYDVRIRYRSGGNVETAYSPVLTLVTSVPAAPANFTGVLKSPTSIEFAWNDSANETLYRLGTGAHVAGETGTVTTAANVTQYLLSGLGANTSHARHLHAENGAGQSAATPVVTVWTGLPDPSDANFTALITNTSAVEIVVSFPNSAAGLSAAEIYRTTDNATPVVVSAKSKTYTVTHTVPSNLDSHRFWVKLWNGADKPTPESPSKVVSFLPLLLAPEEAGATNSRRPVFDWTDLPAKPTFTYELQVSTASTFATLSLNQTAIPGSTFTPVADLPIGPLYWRVRGKFSAGGAGPWSRTGTLRIDQTAPGAPALRAPANGGAVTTLRPSFDWDPVSDPSSQGTYTFQLSTSNTFGSFVANTPNISGTNYALPLDLVNGTTYYWRVQAKDGAGNTGAFSSIWSFRVDTSLPAAIALISPSDGASVSTKRPAFSWNASAETGAKYRLQIDTDANFTAPLTRDIANLTTTSHTLTADLAEGAYLWRVQVLDAAGNATSSALRRFSVDTTSAAAAPVINLSVTRKTNDQTPLISGRSAEITGITIKVYVNSTTTNEGTATVAADGTWSYTVTTKPEGQYTIYAKAAKTGVSDSPFSNPAWLSIDRSVNHALNVSVTSAANHLHVSWVASPDPDVIGYDVYRKLDTALDSTYVRLNTNVITDTRWCDSTVPDTQKYRYRVIAIDNTLQE